VAIARDYETKQRWRLGLRKAGDAHGSNMALYAFGGFMALVGAVFVGVFWMA
jgi:hypothetical protein